MLFKKRKFNAEVAGKIADSAYLKEQIRKQRELEIRYKNVLIIIKNKAKCGDRSSIFRALEAGIRQRLKELGFSVLKSDDYQPDYWEVRW